MRIAASPIQSNSTDLGSHSMMFRSSCRSSSPFSLGDLDMWDTRSRFSAQTSAWYGSSTVSGSGFLSKVSTSSTGSSGGLRQNDPGLRKWQSLSHLVPEGATRPYPPTPGAKLHAARGESSFRQAEVAQWLQDTQGRIDTRLDRLRARDAHLSYNMTSLLDMTQKQLLEEMGPLEQEREAAELSQFDKNLRHGELHEKVLKLEKDLLQMRSAVDSGSNDQPTGRKTDSLSRSLREEEFNRQEKQRVDTELCRLREALKEAETRAKTQEEQRNQTLQQLQTSTETQRALLSQIDEMNQRLSHTGSNHSEMQEQLSEANNKISQACLEKAILSTQVVKLEDVVKQLQAKLTGALYQKEKADLHRRAQVLETTQPGSEVCEIHDHVAAAESHANKQDQKTVLIMEKSTALREVNEKLTRELKMMEQQLDTSRSQLQELTAERGVNTKLIKDLEAERSELIRQKEELLSKMNEGGHEMKEKCCQLRESVEVLELEKQKLQHQCLCLEADVLENKEKLQLQEEEHQKRDAARVKNIQDLKAVTSHWTEKWQKVALTLQITQEELEELKKNNSRNERESVSLLRVELEACKQELELERSRSRVLLHRYNGGGEAVQPQDKETVTDLSESSLLLEPPADSHSSQNKSPQASEDSQDVEDQANVSTTDSLRTQQEESRRMVNQQQEEKMSAIQKLQTLKQLYPVNRPPQRWLPAIGGDEFEKRLIPNQQVKDEKPPVEDRKDETVCPVNLETVQQNRMVTEQLKSLFKEREGNETGHVDNTSAAAQTGTFSPQDWTPTPKAVRPAVDRWSCQQSPGLMPVFEEDEESSDLGGEEEELAGEDQMSAVSAETSNLKANNENLLQVIRLRQPIQDLHTAASDTSSDTEEPHLAHCSDECDLQPRTASFYPDGVFLAELVDICSPDEDGV
ncbi:golgin subfamily A member 6-like protein 22 isoform X1 [Hippoglossus hippoglossus]|uniref:golgin subfamily A member 6-like protein 22 isoform X1 n=1 Tax=Hippoglossus hippoglossus TaxID=8267 RepID=UPI00148BE8B9|nr:golgin subfamily A member 6-like protein 22 isoform X1 [Hippoglossus hippoglossus]